MFLYDIKMSLWFGHGPDFGWSPWSATPYSFIILCVFFIVRRYVCGFVVIVSLISKITCIDKNAAQTSGDTLPAWSFFLPGDPAISMLVKRNGSLIQL